MAASSMQEAKKSPIFCWIASRVGRRTRGVLQNPPKKALIVIGQLAVDAPRRPGRAESGSASSTRRRSSCRNRRRDRPCGPCRHVKAWRVGQRLQRSFCWPVGRLVGRRRGCGGSLPRGKHAEYRHRGKQQQSFFHSQRLTAAGGAIKKFIRVPDPQLSAMVAVRAVRAGAIRSPARIGAQSPTPSVPRPDPRLSASRSASLHR